MMDDASHSSASDSISHPILLYDGVCGLCNRTTQFVLRHDPAGIFRFASLQSPFAARILTRHRINPEDLDTVYVVINHELPDEQLLPRSDAAIFILKHVSNPWRSAAVLLQVLPRPLRDFAYRLVARNRYRIFGRYDTCPIPSPEQRRLFFND